MISGLDVLNQHCLTEISMVEIFGSAQFGSC